jgi:DNA-binding transcriptional MerR regulator
MPHSDRTDGLRIGDAAQACGLTVRALHHYDSIGLAAPSGRNGAGHRVYAAADVERLCVISRLRPLGLPLAEIRSVLDGPGAGPVLAARLAELGAEIERKELLRRRLAELLAAPQGSAVRGRELLDRVRDLGPIARQSVQHPIALLVYVDLERAHQHLVEVFQLGPGHLARDEQDRVVHAELDVGRGVIWLHQESERFSLRSPASLGGATSSTAVVVEDVDVHFEQARGHGAVIEYEPVDQPYGYREWSARDPEGGLWSFMAAL